MHPRRLQPSLHCRCHADPCRSAAPGAKKAKLRAQAIASFEAAVIYPYDVQRPLVVCSVPSL